MFAIRARSGFDGERAINGPVTVLVEHGRISAFWDGWPELPVEERVLDFPGSAVLPGLIDCHVHLCGDSRNGALDRLVSHSDEMLESIIDAALSNHLAAGVTTVRDLGDRRFSVLRHRVRGDGAISPTIVAAGPPLTTVGGHCWSMGGAVAGSDAIRMAVRERAERGVDVVKVMASGGAMTAGTDVMTCQFTVAELRLILVEARGLGLPVVAHAHGLPAVEQCLQAGVDGIEHCSCLTESGVDASDAFLARLAASRIAIDPTVGKAPGIDPPPAVLALMERTGMGLEHRRQLVGRMHRAGVRLITGTDGGISAGKPHGILPEAVADYVAGGVPVEAALAAATSAAADACGLGNRKGRLRAGFDADLVLVSGNLMDDIGALKRVEAVFVAGEPALSC